MYVRCLMIDFSKAFDTVDHAILVPKLLRVSVRCCACRMCFVCRSVIAFFVVLTAAFGFRCLYYCSSTVAATNRAFGFSVLFVYAALFVRNFHRFSSTNTDIQIGL